MRTDEMTAFSLSDRMRDPASPTPRYKMNLRKFFTTAVLGIATLTTSVLAQVVIASHAGQYNSLGDYAGGTHYVTGAFEGEYRSFFVFNLPVFSTPIVSATLEVFNFGGSDDIPPGFYSENGPETLSFFNFSGSIPNLLSGGTGLTSTFADLGSGPLYGSIPVSDASNGQYVSLFLNATFLTDLNAASGQAIALGGALTSLLDPNGYEFIFGNTDLLSATPAVRLTLTSSTAPVSAIPEPATYALAAVGLLGVMIARRRFKRAVV